MQMQCKLHLWGAQLADRGERRFCFVFSVVPTEKVGSPIESELTKIFRVEVSVTGPSGSEFTDLTDREVLTHVYSYVRQRLEESGFPQGNVCTLKLNARTENGRLFGQRPEPVAVDPKRPFHVLAEAIS